MSIPRGTYSNTSGPVYVTNLSNFDASRASLSAYLYGIGLMFFISPSALVLPSLAMVDVDYGAWLRFIGPFLLLMAVVSALFLAAGTLL